MFTSNETTSAACRGAPATNAVLRGLDDLTKVERLPTAATTSTARRAPKMSVAVVDERRIIAEAIAALIDGLPGVSAQAVAGVQLAAARLRALKPDVVLIGVPRGDEAVLALVQSLSADGREIVLLADSVSADLISFALEHRLGGLLPTDLTAADIAACLDQVVRGRAVLPNAWQRVLANQPEDPLRCLSRRQAEVLELLVAGCTYEEIAERLVISLNTVKFHVRSTFARLGIHSRFEAAHLIAQFGGGHVSAADHPLSA